MTSLFAILLQRSWIALSGLAVTVLVALCLTPQLQGWYYAFVSLATVYTLFDLGLAQVLMSVAPRLGGLQGSGSHTTHSEQFKSLMRQSARLYRWLGFAYLVLIIPAGILFFWSGTRTEPIPRQEWLWPWISLVTATGAAIALMPFLALIEGGGKVTEVALLRLTQGVVGSVACWLMLWQGAGLWAAVMIPGFGVIVTSIWLKLRYPDLLSQAFDSSKELLRHSTHNSLVWSTEVWPLQWRFGLSWMASYMLTQIYTPILFYLSGAVIAGQMGVSFSIANMLAVISNAWTSRHVSVMAKLVLERDWVHLDRLFKRDIFYSTLFYVCMAVILCFAHHILEPTKYGQRVLPFWPFAGLLVIGLITHLTGSLAAQLRAFQKEPLVWVMLLGAGLIVPLAFYAASHYAAAGVIAVILFVQILFVLPASLFVWWRSQPVLRGLR